MGGAYLVDALRQYRRPAFDVLEEAPGAADAAGPAGAGARAGAVAVDAAVIVSASAVAALKTALATVLRGALHPAKCCHSSYAASFATPAARLLANDVSAAKSACAGSL